MNTSAKAPNCMCGHIRASHIGGKHPNIACGHPVEAFIREHKR